MAIPATQIRKGMVIVFEGEPCRVVEFRHHTPGNLRAMIQTKLRSLRSGSSFEHRFRSADTIERALSNSMRWSICIQTALTTTS
jgi:elongation factor P